MLGEDSGRGWPTKHAMKKFYFFTVIAGASIGMSIDYLNSTFENNRLRKQIWEQQQSLENLQQGLPGRRQRLLELQGASGNSVSVAETVGKAVASDVEAAVQRTGDRRLKDLLSKYRIQDGLPQISPGQADSSSPQLKGGR
jgi:hypothetical protein